MIPIKRTEKLLWSRVLLKISGEALMGSQSFGIDSQTLQRIAEDLSKSLAAGVRIAVVIGGGNIFRGVQVAEEGGDRVAGDHMGMLATVMNALALAQALTSRGVPTRILSALAVPQICETFTQRAAETYFEQGDLVLFAGGTGNPFFTTDSAAALRALELRCDVLLKATQVDGVYSSDPRKDPSAERFEHVTYSEVLAKDLRVMDMTAIALARTASLPIVVFSIRQEGGLLSLLEGRSPASFVGPDFPSLESTGGKAGAT